ncbi:MAG: hypothetical protein KJ579_11265, partial [Verrucomicrobia bacterium]|nr:hypothetical protein [Verrucomicrobiota bacterium]
PETVNNVTMWTLREQVASKLKQEALERLWAEIDDRTRELRSSEWLRSPYGPYYALTDDDIATCFQKADAQEFSHRSDIRERGVKVGGGGGTRPSP